MKSRADDNEQVALSGVLGNLDTHTSLVLMSSCFPFASYVVYAWWYPGDTNPRVRTTVPRAHLTPKRRGDNAPLFSFSIALFDKSPISL